MKFKLTDDERDEFRVRKPKHIRCSDRMCGADDCPTCHPEILTPPTARCEWTGCELPAMMTLEDRSGDTVRRFRFCATHYDKVWSKTRPSNEKS